MRNMIIFGIEEFAQQLFNLILEENKRKVVAFCVDEKYLPDEREKCGIPIIPFEKIEEYFLPTETEILFCIGYTAMNKLRQERMDEAIRKGYKIADYCHPSAIIQADAIGYGNIFMEGVVLGQGSKVGNGNIFWPKAHVAHHTIVGSYNFFTISCVIAGNISIENYCVFGANSTVKNGVSIANGTLVGAGAYISRSTEAWCVYVPPKTYKLEGKKSTDFKI